METTMTEQIPLDEWNRVTLSLVQSLLGAISPNFRMVCLGRDDDRWKLQFVLEVENDADRAEIEDIGVEFEALQESGIRYNTEIRITSEQLAWPKPPTRVVFRRREY
jgi:hypothetical protein